MAGLPDVVAVVQVGGLLTYSLTYLLTYLLTLLLTHLLYVRTYICLLMRDGAIGAAHARAARLTRRARRTHAHGTSASSVAPLPCATS